MDKLFFVSWESLLRTSLISIFAYAGLIVMLRLVGNRTLSQLNAFDFIVTVAMGSTLASVILTKDIALSDGLLAFAMLIGLQYAINTLSIHVKGFRGVINPDPALLFYKGEFLKKDIKKHRLTNEEILQVVRSQGISDLADVDAIVLENNGRFSVIKKLQQSDNQSSLANVSNMPSKDRPGNQ